MFKAFLKIVVLAMMLVAFVGQAIAFNSSMPCETSVDSLSTNVSELAKHHDLNSVNTDNQEDCCGIECCDLDCTCTANACSSIAYFNVEVNSTQISMLNNVVYIQQSKLLKAIATLLYRPPIFTS